MKSRVKTHIVVLISAIICLCALYSFDQIEDDKVEERIEELEEILPPLVQKHLDEKIERYKKTILKKCKEKAYEAAEIYIDSLVAEELKLMASDTLKFPAKPIRPELREPIILNDSTFISPIIK